MLSVAGAVITEWIVASSGLAL